MKTKQKFFRFQEIGKNWLLFPKVCPLRYREQFEFLGQASMEARRLRYQLITIFKIHRGLYYVFSGSG